MLPVLEKIQQDFNASASGGKKVSLADLDRAGRLRGDREGRQGRRRTRSTCRSRRAAPTPRRRTPTWSRSRCSNRGPTAFRNYFRAGEKLPLEQLLLEKAYLLGVTAPELTVLIGGLRALGANHGGTKHGVFTDKPGVLTNDFFINLLDMGTQWKASETAENVYEGTDPPTGR